MDIRECVCALDAEVSAVDSQENSSANKCRHFTMPSADTIHGKLLTSQGDYIHYHITHTLQHMHIKKEPQTDTMEIDIQRNHSSNSNNDNNTTIIITIIKITNTMIDAMDVSTCYSMRPNTEMYLAATETKSSAALNKRKKHQG